ncbi:MAG TPA: hypothetical protein ENI96_10785 [Sedimenticola thiotaurini]|uniref:Uncharacterized protein n=1 Tax=Sedimenticola thiotaurini TaxID=1543721 RepID=A0A831RPS3_9GAMM|nr:hypothetical protein [Sedimenticola thiotaurini]
MSEHPGSGRGSWRPGLSDSGLHLNDEKGLVQEFSGVAAYRCLPEPMEQVDPDVDRVALN